MANRPNFILIFPDQWRGDCLGSLGHVVETPYLDEMASEGITFTSAYSACPSCIATRASMATGQSPSSCGRLGYKDKVPWRYETTLMRCLRDGNYQTLNVGKTHFYPQRAALGFEEMRLYDPQNHEGDFVSDYDAWLRQTTNGRVQDTTAKMSNNSWIVCPWLEEEYLHPNTWTIDTAIELLDRRDPLRPFFLQVGFHRPHPPLDPPLAYFERYLSKQLPPVPMGQWAEEYNHPVTRIDTTSGRLSEELLDRARKAYYAQISHLDFQIGRLLYWLGRRNWLEETYIIFTSDHGELLGDHNLFRKTTPHEGSAKVPFIVRPPSSVKGPRNIQRDEPITHMDVMPTLLEAAEQEIPRSVEGASLQPLIRGKDVPWREFIHGEHSRCPQAWQFVTNGKEKYIWETISGKEQFFDLTEDPDEEHNRVEDPQYQQRVQLWRSRLIEVLAQRPEDGLSDGERLIAGESLPAVRPELLEPKQDPDGRVRPVE